MRTETFRLDPNGPFHTGPNYHACLRHLTVIEDVSERIRAALKSLATLGASAYPALPQLIKMLGAYLFPYRPYFRGGHPFDPFRKDLADAIIAIGAGAAPNLLRTHADTLVAMMASHTWNVVSWQINWRTWSAAVHAVLAAFKYKCEVENIEIISIFEVRVSHATHLPAKEWARAHWQMRPLSLSQRASGGDTMGFWL